MNKQSIIGLLLLMIAVGAILYGTNVQNSFEYELSAAIGKHSTNITILIYGGILATLSGIILLVNHKNRQSKTFDVQASVTRLIHAILSGIALIAFLFFPVITLGNKIAFTGIDILRKSDKLSGEYELLFIMFLLVSVGNILLGIIPIRQRKTEEQRRDRIYASILMLIPLLGAYLLLTDQEGYLTAGNGLIGYAIASLFMILCNCLFEDEHTSLYTQTKKL